jgi:hypothetical protein
MLDRSLLAVGRFLNGSVRGPNWLRGGSAGSEGSIFRDGRSPFCALLMHFRFPEAM